MTTRLFALTLLFCGVLWVPRAWGDSQKFIPAGGQTTAGPETLLSALTTTVTVAQQTEVWYALVNLQIRNASGSARQYVIRLAVNTVGDITTQAITIPANETLTIQLPQTYATTLPLGANIFTVYLTGGGILQPTSYLSLTNDTSIYVITSPGTLLGATYRTTITTSGIAQALVASATPCARATVRAALTNAAVVQIAYTAATEGGVVLEPGDVQDRMAAPSGRDCADLWISGTAGDVVSVVLE